MIKKGDVIAAACIIIISFSVFLFTADKSLSKKTVLIKQNNKVVFSGSLSENKTVKLKGNTVKIEDGKVFMSDADCKNQICTAHKEISKSGDTIICLPNKVIVEIK